MSRLATEKTKCAIDPKESPKPSLDDCEVRVYFFKEAMANQKIEFDQVAT